MTGSGTFGGKAKVPLFVFSKLQKIAILSGKQARFSAISGDFGYKIRVFGS